jgi:hypothetical protein
MLNPKTEIEPRMARKGTDGERVMETFTNLFGVDRLPKVLSFSRTEILTTEGSSQS